MEKENKEINTKIEKFEKVKQYRDLNSLKLIIKSGYFLKKIRFTIFFLKID